MQWFKSIENQNNIESKCFDPYRWARMTIIIYQKKRITDNFQIVLSSDSLSFIHYILYLRILVIVFNFINIELMMLFSKYVQNVMNER